MYKICIFPSDIPGLGTFKGQKRQKDRNSGLMLSVVLVFLGYSCDITPSIKEGNNLYFKISYNLKL